MAENMLYMKKGHNHLNDPNFLALISLKQNVLLQCAKDITPHRNTFDEEMSKYLKFNNL